MIQWYMKIQYCFHFMFRPLHQQAWLPKKDSYRKTECFVIRSIVLTLEPWSTWSRVYEAVSQRQECSLCRSQIYFKLWWIQQRRNNVLQRFRRRYRGRNGELVWTAVHLAHGNQSVHYPSPRLKWTQCAEYWWTFMNTVINLWGSKDLLTYRSTTIFSRRNLFHEGDYTQRHSPRCRVISQFIGSHSLTNLFFSPLPLQPIVVVFSQPGSGL